MHSSDNRIVIACAGSGKTRRLVEESLKRRDRRIAILTYTNNNVREIIKRFDECNSGVPPHVDVRTWFGFLLRECARPYQRAKYDESRIESLSFVNHQSAKGVPEANTKRHYFANGDLIFSDKIAKFVVECERQSQKKVTTRLRQVYTDIYIDEFQDLAGWDLEVVRMLLESGMRVTLVGDPRQHIYSTNPSSKNKKYLGVGVVEIINKWQNEGLCENDLSLNDNHRCNQFICDFANRLWPGMNAMQSSMTGFF